MPALDFPTCGTWQDTAALQAAFEEALGLALLAIQLDNVQLVIYLGHHVNSRCRGLTAEGHDFKTFQRKYRIFLTLSSRGFLPQETKHTNYKKVRLINLTT